MLRRVLVASGGSGDLVSALALAHLPSRYQTVAYATAIWERAALDPRPGPRDRRAVSGLRRTAHGALITGRTTIPGGWSPLPRLVATRGIRLYYLDVTAGTVGLARQLSEIVSGERADMVELVDAGGDILAAGHEPGLCSPALDAMMLAATDLAGIPALVTAIGLGLDGELTRPEWEQRRARLRSVAETWMPSAVADHEYARLSWFPSEASLLMLLAARGNRGVVAIHPSRPPVQLARETTLACTYDAGEVAKSGILAELVAGTSSFAEVDSRLRGAGLVSELAHEQAGAPPSQRIPGREEFVRTLAGLSPPATHLSLRALAKLLSARTRTRLDDLDARLASALGAAYRRPMAPAELLTQRAVTDALLGHAPSRGPQRTKP
jgi:hypothetical protein